MCAASEVRILSLRSVGDTERGSVRVAVGSTRLLVARAPVKQETARRVASLCWWTGNVDVPCLWPHTRKWCLSAALSGSGGGHTANAPARTREHSLRALSLWLDKVRSSRRRAGDIEVRYMFFDKDHFLSLSL